MNIKAKRPYLAEVEPDQQEDVILAVGLLEAVRGASRLGFELDFRDLTPREFNLVSYLSGEVDKMR